MQMCGNRDWALFSLKKPTHKLYQRRL